jgi:ATP-binding cassette, subfamily C, bacterial CydC
MIRTLTPLRELTRPPLGATALSWLLAASAVGFGVALMTSAGYLISRAAEQPPILSLTMTIVAVRFFGLARPIARYLERLSSHDAALRTLGSIRRRAYERIEPLAPAQLTSYRSGELLGRLVGDVEALQGLYVRGFGPPVVALTVGVASVSFTAWFLPWAAVVLAVGLLVGGVAVPIVAGMLNRAAGRRQSAARAQLTAELVEVFRGAPELVAYGREDDALARIGKSDRELARLASRDALAAGLADALAILAASLTVAGVLAVAVASPGLDRVLIATLALLALASFESVQPLTNAARELAANVAAGRRVVELVDHVPAVRDPLEPRPAPQRRPVVALECVSAGYESEGPVLEGVDLRLEPGGCVALVGPSGSGKTTVTSLLLRFLDPERGRVTIAGHDIREYRQEDVRATFALAGQDAHLFDTTIRANLELARPGATDGELWSALRRARLADWVGSLHLGLDTRVGVEGVELSGGQRARLVIARAFLADAPVLLLDEPTAHLDHETAEGLLNDIFAAADDRSVLLITHRPEGLDHADQVVRLVRSSSERIPGARS